MVKKYVDRISREEFLITFQESEKPGEWFSEEELRLHPFPENAGSLAARYLIKQRIIEQIGMKEILSDIEILNDGYGKPEIILQDRSRAELKKSGIQDILCSISHSRNHIVGMTVLVYDL